MIDWATFVVTIGMTAVFCIINLNWDGFTALIYMYVYHSKITNVVLALQSPSMFLKFRRCLYNTQS